MGGNVRVTTHDSNCNKKIVVLLDDVNGNYSFLYEPEARLT